MTERARRLLEEALALSAQERALLAEALSASLDDGLDEALEPAFLAELERRARDAAAHPEASVPWPVVEGELAAWLRSRSPR